MKMFSVVLVCNMSIHGKIWQS